MTGVLASAAAGMAVMLIVLGPLVACALLLQRRKRMARRRRKSPLTSELLRTPGHGLPLQLEELRLDVASDIATLMFPSGMVAAYFYLHQAISGRPVAGWAMGIILAGVLGFTVYQVRSMWVRSEHMDKLRLGLDAELAVGQELDQLMREGAVVFHDLPADKFNIDHVVIAPQGVFAIETKGYAKPNRAGGASDAKVVFDGTSLAFPDWSSSRPLEQAERQARWLADWLSSATGEPVHVTPALALPGWFVERKGRGPVLVFSGRELRGHLLKARTAQPLSGEQMRRVTHQVEQRCRDVEPHYRPDEASK